MWPGTSPRHGGSSLVQPPRSIAPCSSSSGRSGRSSSSNMTALANLGSLFGNPPTWKEIKVEGSAVTEIFGELHFQEDQDRVPEISPDWNSESLQLCTEGLGFESSDSTEIFRGISRETTRRRSTCCSRRQERPNVEFPPPISSIGGGKPRVRFRSFRRDGRFVLKEFRLPSQEFLRAFRKDGRLTLHFVHPGDERRDRGAGKIEGAGSAVEKID